VTVDQIPELYYFFFGGLMSAVIAFILLFVKIKASIHLIGTSALTAFVIGLSIHYQHNSLSLISILFVINGMVASSRLEMKAHTIKELALGFIIGLLPQILLLWLWL